jgi:GNAT superfamily N-acetyltransferase
LEPKDDRSRFASGNVDLDRFFARFAGQNQFRHHIGTTYVALATSGDIVGFVTVSAAELTTAHLPEKSARRLPAYPLPVLRLARLAVDQRAQGEGVASDLMRAVFSIAHTMATTIGCIGVVVDAKADAVAYSEQFGFASLDVVAGQLGDRPEPLPMFLEIGAIPRPVAQESDNG